jgi:hypothetical protein
MIGLEHGIRQIRTSNVTPGEPPGVRCDLFDYCVLLVYPADLFLNPILQILLICVQWQSATPNTRLCTGLQSIILGTFFLIQSSAIVRCEHL